MASLTSLVFTIHPDNAVQADFRYDAGNTMSFDVAQLPDLLKQVLGDICAMQAATIAQQSATINAQTADITAKDANVQELLAQVTNLTAQVAALTPS